MSLDTLLEDLQKLKPVRVEDPTATITAGNASQLSDGASACVLMEEAEAQRLGQYYMLGGTACKLGILYVLVRSTYLPNYLLSYACSYVSTGLEPLGAFVGFAVGGCEPDEMGIGPTVAVPKLLKRHGT